MKRVSLAQETLANAMDTQQVHLNREIRHIDW